MKAMISSDECTLLNYSEVADWFGVPEGYILISIIGYSQHIRGRLQKINELKLNEVVVAPFYHYHQSIIKKLEAFKKRFNLTEKVNIDIIVLIPEDNNRVEEIEYSGDDLIYYLKERPSDVYFKIAKSYRRVEHCFKIPES